MSNLDLNGRIAALEAAQNVARKHIGETPASTSDSLVCVHASLRSKCELCERDEHIYDLYTVLARMEATNKELRGTYLTVGERIAALEAALEAACSTAKDFEAKWVDARHNHEVLSDRLKALEAKQ